MTLPPPDSHYLTAAIGWLELGNPLEALAELDRINSTQSSHPDVLNTRWSVLAQLKKWDQCVNVARKLITTVPTEKSGWLHLSYALHELKQTQAAYDNLCSILERFPNDWLIRYNLACYTCTLGHLDEAERWLAGAMLQGDAQKIRDMAREDPDLVTLFQAEA